MKFFKRKEITPFLLLTFPVVIDCIVGLQRGAAGEGDSMAGILYKGGIILYSLKYLHNQKVGNYIKKLYTLFVFCCFYQLIFPGFEPSRFVSFIKSTYSFFLLAILLKHKNTSDVFVVIRYAIFYGLGAAIILLASRFFGLGYASYDVNSMATKGFFVATNDIGLALVMVTCYSIYMYQKTLKIIYLIMALLISFSSTLLGSMAAIGGGAIVWICFLFSMFILRPKDYKANKWVKLFVGLAIIYVIIKVIPYVIELIQSDVMSAAKLEDPMSAFTAGNGRTDRKVDLIKVMFSASVFDWIFGFGKVYYGTSELDYMDLTGFYGLILAIMIMYYPIKALYKSIKFYFKTKSILYYWIAVVGFIFIGHAMFAGHGFTSVLSFSIYIVSIYMLEKNHCKVIL